MSIQGVPSSSNLPVPIQRPSTQRAAEPNVPPPCDGITLEGAQPPPLMQPAVPAAQTEPLRAEPLAATGMKAGLMAGLGGWLGAVVAKAFGERGPRDDGIVCEKFAEPEALKAATSTPQALALREAAANIASVPSAQARSACQMLESALSDPEATVIHMKALGKGINKCYFVTLSNGAQAIFKPGAGETKLKLRKNLEKNHQSQREEAAYLVDKAMGHLGRIPPVVSREIDGQAGILMAFIPDAKSADANYRAGKKLLKDSDHPDYRRIAVLDHVIGNLDRHTGNFMITEKGNAVPIDHGISFPLRHSHQGEHHFDFITPLWLQAPEHEALQRLVSQRASVTEQLAPLLDPAAVELMFKRVDRMLEDGKTSTGWLR